ncbi:isochorismate synthase DhbC [Cellvibrio sp. OA-2007]|uniref:isochorismate synthase DhbC n=1 Tax=Cellvibrio sp. OA-2007 TaxID=529823 RepID=UPI000780940C|nr:isochorismate synthase DhbC [Cellvibrio sp. OA-2007]
MKSHFDVSSTPSDASLQAPLLDGYAPENSLYFSSPRQSLLAKPPFANLLDAGMQGLLQRVTESLRFARELGHSNPRVVGAIGFDAEAQSWLRLSTCSEIRNTPRIAAKAPQLNSSPGNYQLREVPTANIYLNGVKDALARFVRGELEKVVLSRTLEVQCEHTLDIKQLLGNLEARNPNAYTFAVKLGEGKHFRTLIGASPELLISRQGNRIVANPLAGTEPRSSDPAIDQARAEQLFASAKDRYEHALVIQAVVAALQPFCKELQVPAEPSLINTPTLWHLSTRIEGVLEDPQTSSLELALAMHPTPAVCGYPTDKARTAIREIEGYDRGMFTGMVGWCDSAGDGEWVVTIRCAEVEAQAIRLYAGAGVVAGSNPEKELAETGAKFNTMLNALGIHL